MKAAVSQRMNVCSTATAGKLHVRVIVAMGPTRHPGGLIGVFIG